MAAAEVAMASVASVAKRAMRRRVRIGLLGVSTRSTAVDRGNQ
jgi:hypothetical protein